MMTNKQSIQLDLGCGLLTQPGFIGVDRFFNPNVDVIADLDAPLPFVSNSVDLVFASHSLEHVEDLLSTMKEVFRVCKDRAQVCIVAPYYQQGLNLANPYHKQTFNEHTPRFWTNSEFTSISPEEYVHPNASKWGLSESDNSKPEIDLRCLKIDFTYFPEYLGEPIEELRIARRKNLDVCDQIIYHLVAIKQSAQESNMEEIARDLKYYQPPYVEIRKLHDENRIKEYEISQLQQKINDIKARALNEIELVRTDNKKELELVKANARDELEAEKAKARDEIAIIQKETEIKMDNMKAQVIQLQMTSDAQNSERSGWKAKAFIVSDELEKFRERKIVRLLNCLARNPDWDSQVPKTYQQFIDDIHLFQGNLRSYHLAPSTNLQTVPFIYYFININRTNLDGILLSIILTLPGSQGVVGIEIVTDKNEIVARSEIPVLSIQENLPAVFNFAPLSSIKGKFWLRVYAKNINTPVRIFELRRNGLIGYRHSASRAFCGFTFSV